MSCITLFFLFYVLSLPLIIRGTAIFQSIPFDPFRLECPKSHGLVEVSMRLVDSAGGARTDIIFTTACDDINHMFPADKTKQRTLRATSEREDCRWSNTFDPMSDNNLDNTCAGREYLAGVSRVVRNRVQFLCCQLRTRELDDCRPFTYPKPSRNRPLVQFHFQKNIIASLQLKNNQFTVVFCKVKVREIEEIMADEKTTLKPTTKKTTIKLTTTTTTTLPTTTTTVGTTTKKRRVIFVTRPRRRQATKAPVPATITEARKLRITSKKPLNTEKSVQTEAAVLQNNDEKAIESIQRLINNQNSDGIFPFPVQLVTGADGRVSVRLSATDGSLPVNLDWLQSQLAQIQPVPNVQKVTPKPTTITTKAPTTTTTTERPTTVSVLKAATAQPAEMNDQKQAAKSKDGILPPGFVELPPIPGINFNAGTMIKFPEFDDDLAPGQLFMEAPADMSDKSLLIMSIMQPKDMISTTEKMIVFHKKSKKRKPKVEEQKDGIIGDVQRVIENPLSHGKLPDPVRVVRVIENEPETPREAAISSEENKSPSDETLSFNLHSGGDAPPANLGWLSSLLGGDKIRPPIPRRRIPSNPSSPSTEQLSLKLNSGHEQPEVNLDWLIPGQSPERKQVIEERPLERQQTTISITPPPPPPTAATPPPPPPPTTTTTTSSTTTTTTSSTTTTTTPTATEETVFTFCTKDIAVVDRSGLVVACGIRDEIWFPSRCPAGTRCFISPDSTFRICCHVHESWPGKR